MAVTGRGFVNVDFRMRINVPRVFAIRDVVGQLKLAHMPVHEAHAAAEVIALNVLSRMSRACTDAPVCPQRSEC
jgi:dihydrolipoamide dehydrogenase